MSRTGSPSAGRPYGLARPCRVLEVPRSTVYELTRSRRLPHVKVGRRTLFVRSDLDAWIVASRVMPLN